MSKRRSRKRRSAALVNIILIAVAVMCFIFIMMNVFGENDTLADQNSLFNISQADDAAVIIDGEQSEKNGKFVDGRLYVPYETVWNDIDTAFYVEGTSDTMYMALPAQTLTWTPGDGTGFLYKDSEGGFYISAECIDQYSNAAVRTYGEPYRIVVNTRRDSVQYVSATEDCVMRCGESDKTDIALECDSGDVFELISQAAEWSFVLSEDGHTGYIRTEYLTGARAEEETAEDASLAFEPIEFGQTVKMAWDYIGSPDDNAALGRMMEGTTGLNVISPTWFALADTSGNISSLADAAYMDQAKNTYGLSVWALVGDYTGEDTTTGAILSSYENRQRCISQLISNALTYGIDGINIDFEDIEEQYAPAYIEFLREFTQQAHMNGIIVSVDNYVPGYTDHYRRDAQNDIADYVVMMGYDEHTAYTAEYGSVASLPYVEAGITATLEEVDAGKLVLGVPFYTRGWIVPFGSDVFESVTLFMSDQEEFISEHGIELTWDASAGQYTGSSEDESCRYYIWTETSESLSEKLGLVNKYGLAGASGWRLGMETDDIWPVWNEQLG